jgi:hypothetical protein
MRPPEMAAEIAKRSLVAAAPAGLVSAHYPSPGGTPAVPSLVIIWDGMTVTEMSEQFLMLTFRGLLFTAIERIEDEIVKVDELVIPIVDAFSNNLSMTTRSNYHLGGGVEYCRVERAELSVPITYNAKEHYGGVIHWGVKARRFAGDA